jgi:heme exporter protein D
MNFASWHDFFYMGGHYLYVWLSYGIGIAGIALVVVRPLTVRRSFFRAARRQVRRAAACKDDDNASDPA